MSVVHFCAENSGTCIREVSGDLTTDSLCQTCVVTSWKSMTINRVYLKDDAADQTVKGK